MFKVICICFISIAFLIILNCFICKSSKYGRCDICGKEFDEDDNQVIDGYEIICYRCYCSKCAPYKLEPRD